MEKQFITSYSGATFRVDGDILIKQCRNLYGSGLMQMHHSKGIFKTPIVYGLGDDHIAMHYIENAVSLPDYLNTCTTAKAIQIVKKIINYIDANIKYETIFIKPDIISSKIRHITARLHDFNDIALANDIENAFGKSPIETHVGNYHGDLTFNNILIDSNDEVYLIDFLPGYMPTHWLDIIKLQQECSLSWSRNFVICGYNYEYAITFLQPYLDNFFLSKHGGTLRLMEALNYLRILPYTNGNDQIAIDLRNAIKRILK